MVDRQFVLSRPDGDVTQPTGKAKALELSTRYMRPRGPWWRMKERGDKDWGQERDKWDETHQHLAARLDSTRIGERIILDGQMGAYQQVIHVVDAAPQLIQTEGNNRIDEIWTWAHDWAHKHNVNMSSGGICVKKDVAGTDEPSQHSPWVNGGANACDIFLPTMNLMVAMAEDAVRAEKAGALPLGRAIIGGRIWDAYGQGWHDYDGIYHYHDHLEGNPEQHGAIRAHC